MKTRAGVRGEGSGVREPTGEGSGHQPGWSLLKRLRTRRITQWLAHHAAECGIAELLVEADGVIIELPNTELDHLKVPLPSPLLGPCHQRPADAPSPPALPNDE